MIAAQDLPEAHAAALAAMLGEHLGVSGIGPDQLELLPQKGLVHDHIRVKGLVLGGRHVLLRLPRASPWGLDPATALAYEAAAFERTAPGGHVPHLFATIAPSDDLARGALLVEEIDGRPPRLPDDLAAIATALAATHALALAPAADRAPLADHPDPVAGTLARIEEQTAALGAMPMAAEARAALDEELRWARGFAAQAADREQPRALVFSDTHPGNFLIEDAGRAVCVDLEKALYGAPAIDLAHATLTTSTLWDADCAAALSRAEVADFYRAYLAVVGPALAGALEPWLLPLRRLTWLRTMTFCARWRVACERRGDWPPARLSARYREHLAARVTDYFTPSAIADMRAEWLGPDALELG